MKKNRISNLILILVACGLLFLTGCATKMHEFVDVQPTVEEESLQGADSRSELAGPDNGVSGKEGNQPAFVHICGAVVNPGVYELPAGSRIIDAVDMAGGLNENADGMYVNLAAVISDGEQIFIPTVEEALVMKQAPQQTEMSSGKVNINTADKALLCSLPGIGDTRAAAILAYRQEHGSFSAIEDIMQVSGIKESSFQKIKELIVVN